MKKLLLAFLLITHGVIAQNYSYIWGMHFPSLIEPTEQCCFDYDNDGSLDDGLGAFLDTLQNQSGSNFQESINQAILDNSLVKSFDWQSLDLSLSNQSFSFHYLDAEILTPNLSLVDRMSGLTQLIIPTNQNGNIFTAINDTGSITATAPEISGLLNLQFDPGQGLVPLTLLDVKAEAQLSDSPNNVEPGIYTDDIIATNPEIVGGMKIGGILTSDEFLGVLDEQYRTCNCANVDPNQPLIVTEEFFGTLIVSCDQSGLTPENCPVQSFCSTVGDFCTNAIGIGTTFDIDYDNNGVNDSYSVALRFGAAATTVDIIFANGFENP